MPDTVISVLDRIAAKLEARPRGSAAAPANPPAAPLPANSVLVYGARMRYVETGSATGDPVLFVHGNPASSYVWRNVMVRLSPAARAIAVDLAGMGGSDKPKSAYRFLDHYRYFEGFIAQLGLRNVTLVLHDWGSALGFHYAKLHGRNVKAIAFLEAVLKTYPSWEEFPRPGAPPIFRETFASFRGENGRKILIDSNTNFIDLMVKPVAGVSLSAEELQQYRAPFPRPEDREPVWRWPNEIPVANDPPDVAELVDEYVRSLIESPAPKLLIYHPSGVITTEQEAEWCRANLKNLQTVRLEGHVEGAIHFLQERYPAELGDALSHWLGKL
jgi:haloalkane dehalogenase